MDTGYGIGIDGGGGSLKWLIRSPDGSEITGSAPGAVLQLLGWEAYSRRLEDAIQQALSAAEAPKGALTALGMGLSGCDRPPEVKQLHEWAPLRFPGLTHLWAGNDALPALRQGAGRLNGVILIAGTGTIAIAVPDPSEQHRVGGWGTLLGDEGGAGWIGLQMMRLAVQMADGRVADSGLVAELLERTGVDKPINWIPWISQRSPGEQRGTLASLAPIAFARAAGGDAAVAEVLKRACEELARLSVRALRVYRERVAALGRPADAPTLVTHGAMLGHQPAFFAALRERIGREDPAEIVLGTGSATAGALALALDGAGLRLTPTA